VIWHPGVMARRLLAVIVVVAAVGLMSCQAQSRWDVGASRSITMHWSTGCTINVTGRTWTVTGPLIPGDSASRPTCCQWKAHAERGRLTVISEEQASFVSTSGTYGLHKPHGQVSACLT
jgi:hypothetical protein